MQSGRALDVMKLKYYISTIMLSAAFSLPAASVHTAGGTVSFADSVPMAGKIEITFAPCMANELFTFSEVKLNGTVVNRTVSDNIGPFGLAGGGWSGGNHLNSNMRSARTENVRVFADGRQLDIDAETMASCDSMVVEVTNTLLMPADTAIFATEHIRYTVCGNSIEVDARHTFHNAATVTVDRYYGMQSMFIDETEMLTPGGAYGRWTPIAEVNRFTKASAPHFTTFVEHSPAGYQAAWLNPATGIGDRHLVEAGDVVFIGNSWTKSYHKTIGGKPLKAGDTTHWHGVYSWFETPFADNCRQEPGTFAYIGRLGSRPALFTVNPDGTTIITLIP